MLWRAGQERQRRDMRDRMAAHFVAARDAALDAMVKAGQAKPVGAWHLPGYVRAADTQPMRSPAARDATLARLGAMFPGSVSRRDDS